MGMKKKSQRGKGSYAAYVHEDRFAKNKRRKIERHLKKFPNDEIAKEALTKVGSATPRSAPKRINSRFGMESDMVRTVKNGKTKSVEIPRSINLASGRLSSSGKFQQQMMKLKRATANMVKYGLKSKLEPVGDKMVPVSELAKIIPIKTEKPRTKSSMSKKQMKGRAKRSKK